MSPLDVIEGRAKWCVMHGDNREILPALADKSVAHVITDPPYSEHVHGKQRRLLSAAGSKAASEDGKGHAVTIKELGFDALTADHRAFCAAQFARLTQRWCLAFSDLESTEAWLQDMEEAGLRRWRFGVWNKLNCQPQLSGTGPAVGSEGIAIAHSEKAMRWNGGGLPARWNFPIATDNNGRSSRIHTTQKPEALMTALIEQFTDPDDIILDPFCGGGTTGVAAVKAGRRFIGIELTEKYARAARARIEGGWALETPRDEAAGQSSLFEVSS